MMTRTLMTALGGAAAAAMFGLPAVAGDLSPVPETGPEMVPETVAVVDPSPVTGTPEGQLDVLVDGTMPGKGSVRVNLYASPEAFLKREQAKAEVTVPETGDVRASFAGLVPGTYAVVAYYDLNGNKQLDRGLFGIPLEPLGFSNGVVPVLSAPDYEEAAVAVTSGAKEIGIKLEFFGRSKRAGT